MANEKKAKRSYATARLPFGKQRIMTWLAYVAILVLSVLASCYDLLFNIENFDANKFVTKLSISICIAIMALLMAIRDGKTTNESKKSGDYFDIKQKFKDKVDQLVNKEWFRQWCNGVLYERERTSAISAILNEYGITDYEYMLVTDADLEALKTEPRNCIVGKDKEGKDIVKPLDVITENQAKLLKILRTNFRFKQLDYSYFTSQSSGGGYAYYANLKDNQRKRKVFALAYRVFMILATTSILALAAINPHDESAAQVAFDTTGRIVTLLSSCFMGYALANDEMAENIDAMVFKIEKIDEYLIEKESGLFVPVSKDEQIRARIEEIEKKRAEEAKKAVESVVTPDVITPTEDPPAIEYREVEMTEDQYAAFSGK